MSKTVVVAFEVPIFASVCRIGGTTLGVFSFNVDRGRSLYRSTSRPHHADGSKTSMASTSFGCVGQPVASTMQIVVVLFWFNKFPLYVTRVLVKDCIEGSLGGGIGIVFVSDS